MSIRPSTSEQSWIPVHADRSLRKHQAKIVVTIAFILGCKGPLSANL